MFGFLKRTASGRREDGDEGERHNYSPFAGSPETSRHRAVGLNVPDEDDLDDERSPGNRGRDRTSYFDRVRYRDEEEDEDDEEGDEEEDAQDEDNDNEDAVETPLLPIFSAALLDRLPLYNITHAIRLVIVQRAETTLSWDQLRSPQISQFLVKPIQSQIRTNHFNRATLCALIANCLQFQKEGQMNPGNVGVSRTRALISELLAMRLVKEFTTRELIDALSYDFDPLQGMSPPTTARGTPGHQTPATDYQNQRVRGRGARVSTIEIAIRAQAKRFLAHPLVVQHLEAIWAGTIVFHSEADNLHRRQPREPSLPRKRMRNDGYGTINEHSPSLLPADNVLSRKANGVRTSKKPVEDMSYRRSVTLYDPHDASLFKLSRLRVPRYRQIFSTLSFAVMLGLYISVLYDRSLTITPLEVVFWFWSIGYMLDEVIGFTEQGFGLYILSFWNAFDLAILLLFVCYYVLRLYGIVLADQNRHRIASMAYDALASTAILLFPRLFSVLDHYRYFSQLLIAFRLMAQDLAAILVLILIFCSGFFVAFTLSFSDELQDGSNVAYALFQILMGFTPAAWDKWSSFNFLGKAIMSCFLVICHFLIVTILITVLTNSFMAIVRNAEEEHQFLFAVNTISMVKSDALFSYIAPTNVIGWALSPLRYILPFRQYVKFNRTMIKITHLPVLLAIFLYERVLLSNMAFAPTDLIERPAHSQSKPIAFSMNRVPEIFSPGRRLREPSVISVHKDRALEEVFRRPFKGSTMRTTTKDLDPERRNSSTVVDKWMQNADDEGGASPPMEQPRSVLERLENRKPPMRRSNTGGFRSQKSGLREVSATRSLGSDPDLLSVTPRRPHRIEEEDETINDDNTEILPQETDADGDNEDNPDSDHLPPRLGESAVSVLRNRTPATEDSDSEYFHTPLGPKSPALPLSSAARARLQDSPDLPSGTPYQAKPHAKRLTHSRNASSGTILFAPQRDDSSLSQTLARPTRPQPFKNPTTATLPNAPSGTRTPKPKAARPARPGMPGRQNTAPVIIGGASFPNNSTTNPHGQTRRHPSFNARALDLASEIGDNRPFESGQAFGFNGPASFSETFLRERDWDQRQRRDAEERKRRSEEDEEKGMVNRIMLARMHTLEEGFREVLKEIKGFSSSARGDNTGGSSTMGSENTARLASTPRRSPKKARKGKAKEGERPRSGLMQGGSPVSVVGPPRLSGDEGPTQAGVEGEDGDGEGERPTTAIGPSSRNSESEDRD